MKKQTFQYILGFFLIFSAFPAFADFAATTDGLYQRLSGCASPTTFEAACAADDCGDPTTTTAIICPNSGCTGNQVKYVFGCTGSPSCPSNSTRVGNTATCKCNSGLRQNSTLGLMDTTISCDPDYNSPSSDILAYAISLGLFGGGTASSFAACGFGANPACIASMLTAAAGAGLALSTYLNSGDTASVSASPDPCAGKVCVSVQLDPNKPLTGTDPRISRDADGNFKPEGEGWANQGDGKYTAPVTDGTVTLDTNTDRVTSTTTNSSGATASTVLQSGNAGGGVEVVSEGRTTGGAYSHQIKGSYTEQAVINNQEEGSTGTAPSGGYYQNGSIGGTSGSGSGSGSGDSGSGSGSGDGGGDCAEYDCATETTLKEIKELLEDSGYDEAAQTKDDLLDLGEDGINDAADRMQTMLDDMLENSGLDELFDEIIDSLPIQDLVENNSSNCSYGFNLLGRPYDLSICQWQDQIHSVMAFILFITLSFGITALVFERPEGK